MIQFLRALRKALRESKEQKRVKQYSSIINGQPFVAELRRKIEEVVFSDEFRKIVVEQLTRDLLTHGVVGSMSDNIRLEEESLSRTSW